MKKCIVREFIQEILISSEEALRIYLHSFHGNIKATGLIPVYGCFFFFQCMYVCMCIFKYGAKPRG